MDDDTPPRITDDPAEALADLGAYIRAQREVAKLSLRHFARLVNLSDSYLSQLERGRYQPSGEVLKAIADGLGIAPDTLFRRIGWLPADDRSTSNVEQAINADAGLTEAQKQALLQTYRTMASGA